VFASEESTRRAVMYELGSGSETYPGGYGIDGMSMLLGSGGSLGIDQSYVEQPESYDRVKKWGG
jgi:hypothetical protein